MFDISFMYAVGPGWSYIDMLGLHWFTAEFMSYQVPNIHPEHCASR